MISPYLQVEEANEDSELIFNERGKLVGIKLEGGDALEVHDDGSYTLHEADTDPLQETDEERDTRHALALSLDTTPPPATSTPTPNATYAEAPNLEEVPAEEINFDPLNQGFDETSAPTTPVTNGINNSETEGEKENGEEGD